MALTIDSRECKLLDVYPGAHYVETLVVGDLLCRYEDGTCWLGERKTAHDLANSIKDGRWASQRARLLATGCRVVFIVEGDLAAARFSYESLLGALVNAELRKNYVFRTVDLRETCHLIQHLVEKMAKRPWTPSGLQPPPLLASKRKRDADTVPMRMLMCLPSISERVATALLTKFGSLPALQRALEDEKTFPKVRLDAKHCLGKARRKILRKYLVGVTD